MGSLLEDSSSNSLQLLHRDSFHNSNSSFLNSQHQFLREHLFPRELFHNSSHRDLFLNHNNQLELNQLQLHSILKFLRLLRLYHNKVRMDRMVDMFMTTLVMLQSGFQLFKQKKAQEAQG